MPKFAFKTLVERLDEMPYAGISILGENAVGYKFPYDQTCNHVAREIHGAQWMQDMRLYMFTARSEEQVEAIVVGLRRLDAMVKSAKARNDAEVEAALAKAAKP